MSTTDYIFCPFCGAIKWTNDKSRYADGGRLEYHKCQGCKKFIYTNHIKNVKSPQGLEYFEKTRYSVEATVDKYKVTVFYHKKSTQFIDIDTGHVILVLSSPVTFNWYKNEELVEKIKKYLVFS